MKAIVTIHTEYGEDFISKKNLVEDEYFKEVIQLLHNHSVLREVRTIIIHFYFSLAVIINNSGCFWRARTFSKDAMESNSLTEESFKEDNL